MIDTYSKIVLTVIAVALCVLIVQNSIKPVVALGQADCGTLRPCKIDLDIRHSGRVEVTDPLRSLLTQ